MPLGGGPNGPLGPPGGGGGPRFGMPPGLPICIPPGGGGIEDGGGGMPPGGPGIPGGGRPRGIGGGRIPEKDHRHIFALMTSMLVTLSKLLYAVYTLDLGDRNYQYIQSNANPRHGRIQRGFNKLNLQNVEILFLLHKNDA